MKKTVYLKDWCSEYREKIVLELQEDSAAALKQAAKQWMLKSYCPKGEGPPIIEEIYINNVPYVACMAACSDFYLLLGKTKVRK